MRSGSILVETTRRQLQRLMQRYPHSGMDECNFQHCHRSHHSCASVEGAIRTEYQLEEEINGYGYVLSGDLVSQSGHP